MEGLSDEAIQAGKVIFGGIPDTECTVVSVDNELLTCVCQPLDETAPEINNVRLVASKSNTFYIPKIGSNVIVRMLTNSVGYISMFSDVDSISLNGDNEGGICKADEVIDALLDLKSAMETAVVVPTDGGASLKSTFLSALATFTETTLQSIKNEKVKHGSN